MRRLVTGLLALAMVVLGTTSAAADPALCELINPTTGKCVIEAVGPGQVGTGIGSGASAGGSPAQPGSGSDRGSAAAPSSEPDDEGTPVCTNGDDVVPCSTDKGYWRQDVQCYISPSPADPQPEEGSAVWQHFEDMFNRGPETGAVYPCYEPDGTFYGLVYSPSPPDVGPPPPSPGEVARQAVAQMDLRAVRIGITPGAGEIGIVGLPTWLWVDGADASTYGPITRTASVRGVSVMATARVREVVWDMGDGSTVRCATAGTPYEPRFGKEASPDCGHAYTQDSGDEPGGVFTVSATSQWVVEWEGAGQEGTITLDGLTSEVAVTIGEAQVLVS